MAWINHDPDWDTSQAIDLDVVIKATAYQPPQNMLPNTYTHALSSCRQHEEILHSLMQSIDLQFDAEVVR